MMPSPVNFLYADGDCILPLPQHRNPLKQSNIENNQKAQMFPPQPVGSQKLMTPAIDQKETKKTKFVKKKTFTKEEKSNFLLLIRNKSKISNKIAMMGSMSIGSLLLESQFSLGMAHSFNEYLLVNLVDLYNFCEGKEEEITNFFNTNKVISNELYRSTPSIHEIALEIEKTFNTKCTLLYRDWEQKILFHDEKAEQFDCEVRAGSPWRKNESMQTKNFVNVTQYKNINHPDYIILRIGDSTFPDRLEIFDEQSSNLKDKLVSTSLGKNARCITKTPIETYDIYTKFFPKFYEEKKLYKIHLMIKWKDIEWEYNPFDYWFIRIPSDEVIDTIISNHIYDHYMPAFFPFFLSSYVLQIDEYNNLS